MADDLNRAYIITPVEGRGWRQIVPPRRPRNNPLPFVQHEEADAMKRALFAEYEDLAPYADCASFEMPMRPVPHVFETAQVAPLTELFTDWIGDIVALLKPQLQPPFQTYNPTSKVGFPYFDVPDKQQRHALVRMYADNLLTNGERAFSTDEGAYITMNVRLQTELPEKKRDFLFVGEDRVYSRELSPRDNAIETDSGSVLCPSRTRLVFLPSPWNLVRQVLDTAWHRAQLGYPAFKHNMYDPGLRLPPEFKHAFAFDVKHFERHTAACARARGRAIGGLYAVMTDMYADQPYLVPRDDWRASALLSVNRDAGYSEQFGSGFSEVAPVQKDIFIVLYAQFAMEFLGFRSRHEAMNWVLQGGDERLFIKNYGDDNIVFTNRDVRVFDDLTAFMTRYLHAEPERPLKFLGMLYNERERTFRLPTKSYALKTYVPERGVGTVFRKAPCLGWVSKREVYRQFGEPDFAAFCEHEDDVMLREGRFTWQQVVDQSVKERLQLSRGVTLDAKQVLDRDWLMTEKEKFDSGMYVGFTPSETAPILEKLKG